MAAAMPFYSNASLVLRSFLLAGAEEHLKLKMPSYLWKPNRGRGRKNTVMEKGSLYILRKVKDTWGVFPSIKTDSHYMID